jgi:FixJ family two-component response regulator
LIVPANDLFALLLLRLSRTAARFPRFAEKPMIAIVDDDISVRDAMKHLVRSLGHGAMTFASAEEYLRSDCIEDTSCLITDLRMPGMGGIELQERLIADGHRIPTIFMTAFFNESMRSRTLKAGALGFLIKPFEDASLIRCLDEALKGKEAGVTEQ